MTTTAPVPLTARADQPRPAGVRHEHAWITVSRHATSEGVLRYVRCVSCDAHRVDVHAPGGAAPEAVSRPVEPR